MGSGKMKKRLLQGGAAALLGLLPIGGNALAQDVEQAGAASEAETSDEIVVTARRREEQLSEVPVSVTAIT